MTPMMKMVMNLTSETVLQEAAGRDVIHDPYRELLNADHDRETGLESERPVIELYDIPSWMAILLSLIYFAVSFCAVIGNWMVLWIVIRSKIMRNVTNLFIANLAVADIIIGAFAIPFQFQAALLQKWLLPYFMCSFCPTVQVVSLNVSIFTLVTLSIDRHRAVTQPLKPRISKSTGYLIISCIWIVSILAAVPTFLAFQISFRPDSSSDSAAYDYSMHSNNNNNNSISLNDSLHHVQGREDAIIVPIGEGMEDQVIEPMCWPTGLHDEFWKMYNHVLVALQYMLPIIIISIAYIHMAIVLSTGPGIMNESRGESDRVNHSKRRVIKMLFIVIAIFAICWFPFQAYNILQEIYPSINDYKYINLIWFSCHLFAMSNSCYNPFIYAIYGEKFNQEFRQRFYCCCFWASRVSAGAGAPSTPTTLLRSVDHMTSQVTHLNDVLNPRNKETSHQLKLLTPANRRHAGNTSPAFISSSPECNSLLSGNHTLRHSTGASSPALGSGDREQRHQRHIFCRKKAHKKSSSKGNHRQEGSQAANEKEETHGLQSPVLSEKEVISLSSGSEKRSICREPFTNDNKDDSKVSYV